MNALAPTPPTPPNTLQPPRVHTAGQLDHWLAARFSMAESITERDVLAARRLGFAFRLVAVIQQNKLDSQSIQLWPALVPKYAALTTIDLEQLAIPASRVLGREVVVHIASDESASDATRRRWFLRLTTDRNMHEMFELFRAHGIGLQETMVSKGNDWQLMTEHVTDTSIKALITSLDSTADGALVCVPELKIGRAESRERPVLVDFIRRT